jgi:hypothetical protein
MNQRKGYLRNRSNRWSLLIIAFEEIDFAHSGPSRWYNNRAYSRQRDHDVE